jgi:signal transduction histidine kinase
MTANQVSASVKILLVADEEERQAALRQLIKIVLPGASIVAIDTDRLMEGEIPFADVSLVDGDIAPRATHEALRFLRARGFTGAVVVLGGAEVDPILETMAQTLGLTCITRSTVEESPVELGAALTKTLAGDFGAVAEVAQARRILAAGQAALSLQHSINNPLAALLAEIQLLQLEELPAEQRQAVDRMIELCRRIIALVRRLDALAT